MNREKPDIFICHADDTRAIAQAFRRALEAHARVFVPDDDLLPGDAWDEEVPARIAEAPVVVVIVSPALLTNHYDRDALLAAIDRRRDDPKHRVVPVYAHGTRPSQAHGLRRLKGYDIETEGVNRIVEQLRRVLPEQRASSSASDEPSPLAPSAIRPGLTPIPAGRCLLGSPDDEFGRRPDEGPRREVSITRPFEMATTPVTRAQYAALLGRPTPAGPQRPVVDVSWFDAADFCNRLSRAEGHAAVYTIRDQEVTADWTGDGYRLPTEAEWEYACRGGTATPHWTGGSTTSLLRAAWLRDNSQSQCPEVGQKTANRFGLYDMHGTVWEWCHDWHAHYAMNDTEDPRGPKVGRRRVLRGGSFRTDALGCRSAARLAWKPSDRLDDVGFRIIRPEPSP